MRTIQGMRVLWYLGAMIIVYGVTGCHGATTHQHATVIIETTPESGATVTIGDVAYGQTPVTITTLAPATYYATIEKDGFKRVVEPINVPPSGEDRVQVKLKQLTGLLTVESNPSPAKVTLDGKTPLGDTPLVKCPVPVGKHTYTVEADRCIAETKQIEVEEDYQYTFKHALKPKPSKLIVLSSPTSGQVSLNNQDQATITPATIPLEPGKYLVSVYARGYVSADQAVTLDPGEEKRVEIKMTPGDVPPGMVLIPAGEFLMGLNGPSPDERPQRKVMVNAFYIDKCEVTNAEFKRVFTQYQFADGEDRFPATGVSFDQALEYAKAIGKRLPTEPEWEKAARGADGREYPWGEEFNANLCNAKDSGFLKPREVGQYFGGASPYGCLDMAGNVYEWTSSWYQAYEGNTDIRTSYGQEFRVIRGGSYLTGFFELRCARRHFDHPDAAKPDYGFRCAKDVQAAAPAKKPAS